MKAINRDLKKKLFDECGIAYAVLSANQLRTLEALRGSFLGEMALAHPPGDEVATASQMPTSQPANMDPSPPLAAASPQSKAVCTSAQPDTDAIRSEPPQGIDMTAVAAARSSLQSKLDRNRKVRLAKINQLSGSMGIVDRSANHNAPASWDDSFIMGEDAENYKAARNEIVRPVGGSFRQLDFTRGGEYV